jgi:hypothetical protein
MKNKPDPALLRPSNLSNEIKKRVPKSRETIPLKLGLNWTDYAPRRIPIGILRGENWNPLLQL